MIFSGVFSEFSKILNKISRMIFKNYLINSSKNIKPGDISRGFSSAAFISELKNLVSLKSLALKISILIF